MRIILALIVAALVIGGLVYFVDVDQTREAQLPDVDVNVSGGQAPEFDAETGSVDVGTEKKTVTVPDVDVNTEQKTIDVPTLDVKPPAE
jgi:hypothetical protein